MISWPILSTILLIPVLGVILLLFVPSKHKGLVKAIPIVVSTISLVLSVFAYYSYNIALGGMQFLENISWIPSFGINYSLGIDGISAPLVLLTSIIFFSGVLVSLNIDKRTKEFFIYMMILVSGVFGVFMSRDLFFLMLFLELTVIPKFILINIWGSKNREYAAYKYTLYLLAGSAVALIGIISLYIYAASPLKGIGIYTFDIASLAGVKFDPYFQKVLFFVLLVGFGVFIPIWPLHRWTPDGHSAAPTAISMLLAGVIMKLGGYALIRVGINFFPLGAAFWAPLIAVIATINAVYIALVAMVQKDIKYVVANSSISHMGYVLIGIASLSSVGIAGAVSQMFAHGIMAALFFAVVGNIYDKAHTREISDFGGLAHQMPKISVAFLIAGLASLGLPGLFNFVAEFSIFTASIQVFPILAVISILAIVITAIYILKVFQEVFFGPRNSRWDDIQDANGIEMIPIVLLIGVLLLFGFFPSFLINTIDSGLPSLAQKIAALNLGGIL